MNNTSGPEFSSHDWMTFVDAVRYVATAYESKGDPSDKIVRGLSEVREALIEGKIPTQWVDDSYGSGLNIYVLYGIDQPRSDLDWAIGYIAGIAAIPDPRPPHLSMDWIAELRRLRHLRLPKNRVHELWLNQSGLPFDGLAKITRTTQSKSSPSKEELQAHVREVLKGIYKASRPNKVVAEQQARTLTGATRDIIRPILKEPEFKYLARPSGNNRGIKT
jgi:hypothetical protein